MSIRGRSWKVLLGAVVLAAVLLAVAGVALADESGSTGFLPLAWNGPAQATVPATAQPPTVPPRPTTTPRPTVPLEPSPGPGATDTPAVPPDAPIVVVPRAIEPSEWANDAATIQSVVLEGDRLTLTIRHGGGCFEHDEWLVASSWFMESYPPQVDVLLSHDAHGDLCRALITRDVAFDLGPLARKAVEGTANTAGVVLLRIRGWPDLVRYEFGP